MMQSLNGARHCAMLITAKITPRRRLLYKLYTLLPAAGSCSCIWPSHVLVSLLHVLLPSIALAVITHGFVCC
jgi:hypothetical protein